MALSVYMRRDPGGASDQIFYLKVEDIDFPIQRRITTIPVPGNVIVQLDLGIRTFTVSLTGTVNDTTDATNIADRYDLLNMETWYADTNSPRLYLDANNYLNGSISKIQIKRSAWMNYWEFRLEFEATSLTKA